MILGGASFATFSRKEEKPASEATKEEILAHCRKHIAKYAMPYDIEFRKELPKTLVGKVAYRMLEEEENAKVQQQVQESTCNSN